MKTNLFLAMLLLLSVAGCNRQATNAHFMTDAAYRDSVSRAFEAKKTHFADTTLFAVFGRELTQPEREALMFLYAYMPIGDIADYDGDFYLRNVQAAFRAREEMPWGKSIPEEVFRHFVLPVRVNNENLDDSRSVFYDELKERVRHLSLHDAVLEVNHWCHEKVIYTPSDARTSSPLASVKTAYGRCGEESTFTVAALRAVGIPARQVYTPRWAHTDDNHAWVEAWVDGKWHFFGACEPEPVLDLAWFNAPASRGMLMHTKVFGYYNGPEEVMARTGCYTEINVIDHYAPAAGTTVTVVDAQGQPVPDALVEFQLYNYAEFFPVANKLTDAQGQASLTAGKGDMLVWASKEGRFGFAKVSFGAEANVTVRLSLRPGDSIDAELDIVPPVEGRVTAIATDEQKAENARRLLVEDSIRNSYVATFYTAEKAEALAGELALDAEPVKSALLKSRGNWAEIENYLRTAQASAQPHLLALLAAVSDKDLRDTPASILLDHLTATPAAASASADALYIQYVLNPRVSNELLTPYKSILAKGLAADSAAFTADPQRLVDWVKQHIRIADGLNPQRIPIMPTGVWRARVADTHSRNIFFVAAARSIGIPARIDVVTGKVQYATANGRWTDVDFEAANAVSAPQGTVMVGYTPIKALDNPKYTSHFTIARLQPDATHRTLDFDASTGGDNWATLFSKPLALDAGHYLMVNGTRMASGKVLARIRSFTVEAGKNTTTLLAMRESADDIQVIGAIDAEAKFKRADNGEETSILATTGRGYFVIGIVGPRQEPTNHAMRDIAAVKADLEQWGRGIILLVKDQQSLDRFDRNEFGALPATITYGIDTDGRIAGMIADAMKLPAGGSLPVFVIADTFGRVVFVSQGYTIGLGEQLMKVIGKL